MCFGRFIILITRFSRRLQSQKKLKNGWNRVTEEEFIQLVVDRELEDGRYISWLDIKIVFDECTKSPHGEIIMEIGEQICLQDRAAGDLFVAGTGNCIILPIHSLLRDLTLTLGTSDEAPDGHW
jgi:hypothetical protein